MNIYNFIFCFFCKKYGNSGPGRIFGSGLVFFAILMHLLLVREIITFIVGHKVFFFATNFSKDKLYLFAGLIIFMFFNFFNTKRASRLIEKYDSRDEYAQQGDTNRIILFTIAPMVLAIVAGVIRQKIYGV